MVLTSGGIKCVDCVVTMRVRGLPVAEKPMHVIKDCGNRILFLLFSETCQISCRSQTPSELEYPKILAAECLGFGYMVMKGLARGSKDID
jgi:hypothetical protein